VPFFSLTDTPQPSLLPTSRTLQWWYGSCGCGDEDDRDHGFHWLQFLEPGLANDTSVSVPVAGDYWAGSPSVTATEAALWRSYRECDWNYEAGGQASVALQLFFTRSRAGMFF
jgi:hypothetical protein